MNELEQFVPSSVCLKCDGCCRYKEADSPWRPKLGKRDQESLSDLITGNTRVDKNGYLKTIQSCGEHFCQFLNGTNNTCGINAKKPFECSLYPFILSQTLDAIKVYAHLSCPYVQIHQPRAKFDAYVEYLKEFFDRGDIRVFLSQNKSMFHDYTPFSPELLYLFDLSSL